MMFTVFSTHQKGRVMHLARGNKTLCGVSLGAGSGLERDGAYGAPMCQGCHMALKQETIPSPEPSLS